MCFTISIKTTRDAIEKRFGVDSSALKDFEFRYYYKAFDYPLIPVITQSDPGKVSLKQWGLVPAWTRDKAQALKIRSGTCNARAESLDEKPSFRKAAEGQRCLVLATGFFEWQHVPGQKIPWYIRDAKEALFALAGIFDDWTDATTSEQLHTFSIVTTRANSLMEKIHNSKKRMPVILDRNGEREWISAELDHAEKNHLLRPCEASALKAHTVGKEISKNAADPSDPAIIRPVDHHIDGKLF